MVPLGDRLNTHPERLQMKIMHLALAATVAVVFTSAASAVDAKLFVGKWEAVKVDEGTLPKGTVVEFGADQKMNVMMKKDGKDSPLTGTYKIDGDSFVYSLVVGDMKISKTIKIKKLTETEMETTNEDGKAVTFKKVK
jgi:uncharacterized protein (TIGR03066 family)